MPPIFMSPLRKCFSSLRLGVMLFGTDNTTINLSTASIMHWLNTALCCTSFVRLSNCTLLQAALRNPTASVPRFPPRTAHSGAGQLDLGDREGYTLQENGRKSHQGKNQCEGNAICIYTFLALFLSFDEMEFLLLLRCCLMPLYIDYAP